MEFHSVVDVREAERFAKWERISHARFFQVGETKVTSPKDVMLLDRFRAAAAERSDAFDAMLRDMDVNRLLMKVRFILSAQLSFVGDGCGAFACQRS